MCSQLVGLALPTDRVADWCIAKDSVQAISCLVEALHLFNTTGRHLLYETSVLGILLILQHLGQNQSYLTIITGGRPMVALPRSTLAATCHMREVAHGHVDMARS